METEFSFKVFPVWQDGKYKTNLRASFIAEWNLQHYFLYKADRA